MWSMRHHRWLTPTELLTVHNYPLHPDLQQYFVTFGARCCFNFERAPECGPRSRGNMGFQAGNGMSACCVGAALMYRLALDTITIAEATASGPAQRRRDPEQSILRR
eukprot:6499772-Pyramimonas_sp.AAC.1